MALEQCFHPHLLHPYNSQVVHLNSCCPLSVGKGHQTASNQFQYQKRKPELAQIFKISHNKLWFHITGCVCVSSTSPKTESKLKVTMSPVTPFICHKSVLNKAILQRQTLICRGQGDPESPLFTLCLSSLWRGQNDCDDSSLG